MKAMHDAHRPDLRKNGFTMVELMCAMVVLAVFVYYAYGLFISGTKTANKGSWINAAIEKLRTGTAILNKEIKASSYPTTLLDDKILEPADNKNATVAQQYYLKIPSLKKQISSHEGFKTRESPLMKWFVCTPEKFPSEKGILIENVVYFVPEENSLAKVGKLKWESYGNRFTTSGPDHAKSGNLNLTPDPSLNRQSNLVDDVEWVMFESLAPSFPTGATDLQPLKIHIHCVFPKDPKTTKENSIMITPNVGMMLF